MQQALHAYHLSLYETKEDYYDKFLASLPQNEVIAHQHTVQQINEISPCTLEQEQENDITEQHSRTEQETGSSVQGEYTDIIAQTILVTPSPQGNTNTVSGIPHIELSSAGDSILNALCENGVDFDTLVTRTNLTPAVLSRELIILEVQNVIKKYPSGVYVKL